MNDIMRKLYAFNHGYCKQLLSEIPEEEMQMQPPLETSAGVNTPAWLLGHLAICTDFALGILSEEKRAPREWMVYFGPGSQPTPGDRKWPSKQEMWDVYSKGHQLVDAASHDIAPELLDKSNPIEFLTSVLPTSGDLLAHLMTTHESLHLGHLSNWRRQMGHKPLF